jgi:hypothetical protein
MKWNLWLVLALCCGLACADEPVREDRPEQPDKPPVTSLPAAAQMPPNVTLVEARMSRRALHALNSTSGIRLPRIQLYSPAHQQVLHVIGWEPEVADRVREVVASEKPKVKSGTRLEKIVGELEDVTTNEPLTIERLPPADFYVITAWAGWCRPCGTAMVELRKLFEADPARRYVWIMIETDVVKQKIQKQTIR